MLSDLEREAYNITVNILKEIMDYYEQNSGDRDAGLVIFRVDSQLRDLYKRFKLERDSKLNDPKTTKL